MISRSLCVAVFGLVAGLATADELAADYGDFVGAIRAHVNRAIKLIPDEEQRKWMDREPYIRESRPEHLDPARIPMGRTVFRYELENRAANFLCDITHPRYEVERGVLRYEFGGLNAFQLRDRQPLDTAVENEFFLQIHRRYNGYWRSTFWQRELTALAELNRRLYQMGIRALNSGAEVPPSYYVGIDVENRKLWDRLERRLAKWAESEGVARLKPLDQPRLRKLRLRQNESFATVAAELFGEDEIETWIYDSIDVLMHESLPGWPPPRRSAVPRDIEPYGAYYVTHRLKHADRVPEEWRPNSLETTQFWQDRDQVRRLKARKGMAFLFLSRKEGVDVRRGGFALTFWYGLFRSYGTRPDRVLDVDKQVLRL